LFGSILTATPSDVWTIVGLGAVIAIAIAITGPALLAVVLDEDSARVAGIPARALNALLAVLTAVTVVAAMRIVGVLLVAALMVLPVATSRLLARSFRATLLGAMAAGVTAAVLGLFAARQWALAAGGTIVLMSALLFALASLVVSVRRAFGRPAPTPDPGALLTGPH
jgi:zinc transport system permease protein